VGLGRGPLSLVSTIEELFERKSSGSGLENRNYGRRGFAVEDYAKPIHPQKLSLTSPTGAGRSVGIVRPSDSGHGSFFDTTVSVNFFDSNSTAHR
jgi:hypothetical protein